MSSTNNAKGNSVMSVSLRAAHRQKKISDTCTCHKRRCLWFSVKIISPVFLIACYCESLQNGTHYVVHFWPFSIQTRSRRLDLATTEAVSVIDFFYESSYWIPDYDYQAMEQQVLATKRSEKRDIHHWIHFRFARGISVRRSRLRRRTLAASFTHRMAWKPSPIMHSVRIPWWLTTSRNVSTNNNRRTR